MEKPFGKYTLLERLGGGGMAEVFKARLHGPEGFEKDLALKLILPHISDEAEFVEMFIREATMVARLDHANIVRIHEFDQIEGRYYIAMELVVGRDLRRTIARARKINRPFSIPEVLVLALEVAKGLAFAHGELTPDTPEVVHRDISPHNIIVSVAGEVKVTDFGIAKMASAVDQTRTGVIKGKAAYMSPEQAQAKPVDRRADLFSLGCVLWELLTCQKLFTGENDLAVLESLRSGPILPPSTHNSAVTEEIDALVMGLLQRDPEKRTKSAGSLARAADQALLQYSGVDRATLLMDLYRDLFSKPETGTGVLPAAVSQSVEPVGPDADTRGDAVPSSSAAPSARRSKLAWVVSSVVVGLAVALGLVFFGPLLWNESEVVPEPALEVESPTPVPEKMPESTPESIPAPLPQPAVATGPPQVEEPVPKSPVRKPRPRVRSGRLDLNVIPWAKVFWKKRFLGETPLERVKLPAGKLPLRLVNQDLGINKIIWVDIQPNQTTQRLVNLAK